MTLAVTDYGQTGDSTAGGQTEDGMPHLVQSRVEKVDGYENQLEKRLTGQPDAGQCHDQDNADGGSAGLMWGGKRHGISS